ncbi:MAG: trypsin-like peptidase domain-containing protein [Candidatus Aminicenantes bacterium]|nr:trypsin-like peptidase domain-containing protein [Candidatus Aminicenantes bacterium]
MPKQFQYFWLFFSLMVLSIANLIPANIPDDVTPYVQLGHLVKISIYKNPEFDAKAKKIISNGELIKESIEEVPVGSGTIVSSDGLILTNYHVYQMDNMYRYDNRINRLYTRKRIRNSMLVYRLIENDPLKSPVLQYLAVPVSLDKMHDTALLKIYAEAKGKEIHPADLTFANFSNPFALKLNENLAILGYPQKGGDTITITEGKFLGYYRNRNFYGLDGFIKTDAAMSPGNSGGAALYRDGLVGVPTAVTPPEMAGSDMGYIHPVTWAVKTLIIAKHKFKFNIQEFPIQWLSNNYNTDETRHHIYMTGWIASSHTMRPLPAEVLMTRSDRTLEQIRQLHLELQNFMRIQTVHLMHNQGLSAGEIANRFNLKIEEIQKILDIKISEITISEDARLYTKGEFFYGVTRCDDRGFFILDVPRNQTIKFYAFADEHRTMVRRFNSGDGVSKYLGKIIVFKF